MHCNDPKPGGTDILCDQEAGHGGQWHTQGYGANEEYWPNLDYMVQVVAPSNEREFDAVGLGIARRARPRTHAPRYNSSLAWKDYQDRLPRRTREVLERLTEMMGTWINGIYLHTQEVGGSQGLKRLRELRADFDANPQFGLKIEERRVEDSDWDYRLARRIPES